MTGPTLWLRRRDAAEKSLNARTLSTLGGADADHVEWLEGAVNGYRYRWRLGRRLITADTKSMRRPV